MSEKARALGIPDNDLIRAMKLVRDLRISAIRSGIDPRATRIAIIYMNLTDYHFAAQKLSWEDLRKLEEIAHDFYIEMVNRH